MAKDTTGELRRSLYGRSSVFTGTVETPIEQIVYHIMYDALKTGENVVWVCLKETPGSILDKFSSYDLTLNGVEKNLWFVDATLTGDIPVRHHTLRCTSMDYVCLTMRVVELLKRNPRSLVILDSIGMLVALERLDVSVRLIKYLDARIRAKGGGFVTLLQNKEVPGSPEAELVGLMDTVIRVENERIHAHVGSRELRIPFSFCAGELILGGEDIERDLRELFCLTPDEKKKLEREGEEKANLYRELIGSITPE